MMVLAKPKASVAANAMNKRRSQQPRTGRVLSGFTPTHMPLRPLHSACPSHDFTLHADPQPRMPFPALPITRPSHLFTPHAPPVLSRRMILHPLPPFHAACPSHPCTLHACSRANDSAALSPWQCSAPSPSQIHVGHVRAWAWLQTAPTRAMTQSGLLEDNSRVIETRTKLLAWFPEQFGNPAQQPDGPSALAPQHRPPTAHGLQTLTPIFGNR